MFSPNNLTVDTTSIAFPLITIGAKSAADLANEIRSSLHFDSFSWNLLRQHNRCDFCIFRILGLREQFFT